jgi:hypothetical protein
LHHLAVSGEVQTFETDPDPIECRRRIEPWLSAVLQSEHLSLLTGNGLTTAVVGAAGSKAPSMDGEFTGVELSERVESAAKVGGSLLGRESPNVEDRIRAALQLLDGLRVLEDPKVKLWEEAISERLTELTTSILASERDFKAKLDADDPEAQQARRLLMSFLLTFASRTATRDRLQLFTTNYDRLIEFGCDVAGLRPLDRFVGTLTPKFRSTRLDIDMHYSPPGIRGEPRYLEGVLRYTKLHGSIDWRSEEDGLARVSVPFGATPERAGLEKLDGKELMIYPNPAKDVETLLFPYAELFRDLSAAICRPNSALVTYGYGFGDDHINRVIADMLSIPSTHLVVISYDWCDGRLNRFLENVSRPAQTSLMIGPHFGALDSLVENYLPKPAIDVISLREAELRRGRDGAGATVSTSGEPVADSAEVVSE